VPIEGTDEDTDRWAFERLQTMTPLYPPHRRRAAREGESCFLKKIGRRAGAKMGR
jgi:hypothetical protein